MCLTSKKSCARLAFSLVELLIVMVVIAVLVAVAVPSFIRFCGNSAQAVMASDLRQHATVFTTYTADLKGFLPYFTDPVNSPTTLTDPIGGHVWPQVFYFSASTLWPLVLTLSYYEGNVNHPSFRSPDPRTGRRSGGSSRFSYSYPCVYIADPKYFSQDRRDDRLQLRATQLSEVLFTSDKALIVNQNWWQQSWGENGMPSRDHGPTAPIHVAMADTSASAILPDQYIAHRFGDGDFNLSLDPSGNRFIASHTNDGVRGRDRR